MMTIKCLGVDKVRSLPSWTKSFYFVLRVGTRDRVGKATTNQQEYLEDKFDGCFVSDVKLKWQNFLLGVNCSFNQYAIMALTLLFFRMTMVSSLVSFIAATASPPMLTNHQSPAPCQLMVCWLWLGQRSLGEVIPAAVSAASLSPVTTSPTLLRPPRGYVVGVGRALPTYNRPTGMDDYRISILLFFPLSLRGYLCPRFTFSSVDYS